MTEHIVRIQGLQRGDVIVGIKTGNSFQSKATENNDGLIDVSDHTVICCYASDDPTELTLITGKNMYKGVFKLAVDTEILVRRS